MGKICPKCGKELRETARFCTSCGTKLEEGIPGNPVNTVNVQNGSINTVMPKQEKKWYQKTGWIIALLIIFFPVGLYLMWKYTDWRKVLKIAVSIVCAVCLGIGFFSTDSQDGGEGTLPGGDYNGSVMSLSDFLERYNEISQSKFAENGIDRQPISMDNLETAGTTEFMFKESVTAYAYSYQSMVRGQGNLGSIFIFVDMNGRVVGANFGMTVKYLLDGDDFQNMVLESVIQTFDPALSEEDINEIRNMLSIERGRPLITVVVDGDEKLFEYDGITYILSAVDDGLTLGMYSSDKLNRQGVESE